MVEGIMTGILPLVLVFRNTLIIYLFLIVCLRLLGRREIAQLTSVELVIILILGSAVETAMVAGNTSLAAGLVSATTLLIANHLLSTTVRRSRRFRRFLVGGPLLLAYDGQLIFSHLQQAGLTEANVREAIRERGYDLDDVRMAVLEIDGSVGVIPKTATVHQGRPLPRSSQNPPNVSDQS